MARTTIEEPKTVVEEVEGYKCDQCKYVGTKNEFYTQTIERKTNGADMSFDLCRKCVDADRHQTLVNGFEKKVEWRKALNNIISKGMLLWLPIFYMGGFYANVFLSLGSEEHFIKVAILGTSIGVFVGIVVMFAIIVLSKDIFGFNPLTE